MALQYGATLRTAQCDAIASTVAASALLRLYSGSAPADCATGPSGTLLCEMALPATWMAAAANGVVAKTGTWSGTGAAGAGGGTNAGYWRLYNNAGTVCHAQGNVTASGGGGDMTLDNISIAQNQTVTINSFQITAGNA